MKENILKTKSYQFALRIIKLCQVLFIHKLGIAQKEANETHYWIRLLNDSEYIDQQTSITLINDCEELLKLITSSIKTAKNNLYNG